MECTLCKNGSTEKGHVTVKLERGNTIVLIKNVPADVCKNCGHYYLSAEMTTTFWKKEKKPMTRGRNWRY